jgi:hypothetical protein
VGSSSEVNRQTAGQWLSLLPSTAKHSVELSAKEEFLHASLLRCARVPPSSLPPFCDGCKQNFSVCHALECKNGGLVISRHNEIQGEKLSNLASKALSPSAVRDEPKSNACRSPEVKSEEETEENSVKRLFGNSRNEKRGDILNRGLWAGGTNCITDVRITDVDAVQSVQRPGRTVSNSQAGEKEEMPRGLSRATLASADSLLGKANVLLRKLSAMLPKKKWEKPDSEVCGHVNACVSVTIVRAAPVSASLDLAFRRAMCATASRSGRTKQVSASFDNSAPLTPQCLLHSPPAPTSCS